MDIGEGIENMGEGVGCQVLGVEVASIDGPVIGVSPRLELSLRTHQLTK